MHCRDGVKGASPLPLQVESHRTIALGDSRTIAQPSYWIVFVRLFTR